MTPLEWIGIFAGIGTLIGLIIGLSKFFARMINDRRDMMSIKKDIQKINARLLNTEKEQIRLSSYFDYYLEEKWRRKK